MTQSNRRLSNRQRGKRASSERNEKIVGIEATIKERDPEPGHW